MRTLTNPLKAGAKAPPVPYLSIGVVTMADGSKYHEQRREIVNLCITSMLEELPLPKYSYELVIWHNTTSNTPKDYGDFLRSFNPARYIESENVGPHNARMAMAQIMRGQLICFTDDDILFHPDWYKLQTEILDTYPRVGSVSGSPQRTAFRWATSSNIRFAETTPGATIKTGRYIPDIYERDFCASVGRPYLGHAAATMAENDILLEYKGVKAWGHGHHMQQLGPADTIRGCQFCTENLLDNGKLYNEWIDRQGLMNLTTYRRTAVHIGNVLDARILEIQNEWKHGYTK